MDNKDKNKQGNEKQEGKTPEMENKQEEKKMESKPIADIKNASADELDRRMKELKMNDAVQEYIKVTNRIYTLKFTAKQKAEREELKKLREMAANAQREEKPSEQPKVQ